MKREELMKKMILAKISQSCLINPKNVAAINLRKRTIVMLNGEILSFSRRFRHEMDKLVDEYNWKVETATKRLLR